MNGLLKQISSNRYNILRLVGKKLACDNTSAVYLIDKVSFEEDIIYFVRKDNTLGNFGYISHCDIKPDGYYWYGAKYYIIN